LKEVFYSTHHLGYSYEESPVLQDIGIEIARGEIVGIIGPNGAGKSTLLKILGGLLDHWTGDALFRNQPIQQWDRRKLAQQIAYVPQNTHIAFPYSVQEVVLMGRLPHQGASFFESSEDLDQVDQALRMTDCLELSERYFNELSGGERQLVVLASALAQEPETLLLDEPTVFLDLKHQLLICRILKTLHETRRLTMVLVTHDLNLAQSFCDRIFFLKHGRVIAECCKRDEGGLILEPDVIEEVFEVRADTNGLQEPKIILSFGR